jgi:hypothetical protein
MRALIKIIPLLFLPFFFFSCEKTIEFKEKYVQPKIVVNSVIRPGSHFIIKIESSRHILDESGYFESLKGAKVLLYEDEEFVSELDYISRIDTAYDYLAYGVEKKQAYENGFYCDTNRVARAGSTYRLEISKEGFEPVWCETTVPEPVQLGRFNCEMKKEPHEYYDEHYILNMNLEILDNKNEENFYKLSVYKYRGVELDIKRKSGYYGGYGSYGYYHFEGLDSIVPTDTIVQEMEYNDYVYSNDPVLNLYGNTDILETEASTVEFFTDELLNRDVYDLSFWGQTFRNVYYEYGEYLEVVAAVETLSKEFFLFCRSLEQQDMVHDNPFAEPVPVYSNVEGGLGIFGSVAIYGKSYLFGEYPLEDKTYIDMETFQQLYQHSPY